MRDHLLGYLPVAVAINGVETQPSRRTAPRPTVSIADELNAALLDRQETAKLDPKPDLIVGMPYLVQMFAQRSSRPEQYWLIYRGDGEWTNGGNKIISPESAKVRLDNPFERLNQSFWQDISVVRPATTEELKAAGWPV